MILSADKIRVEKHLIGDSVQHMKEFVKPLKYKLGIDSFSYVKLWPGNIESYLTTDPKFCQAYYDDRMYMNAGAGDPKQFKSGYLLLDHVNHEYVIKSSRDFNIHHVFYIIKNNINTCEIFVFGSSTFNPLINNIYLNCLDLLNGFINQFKQTADKLLTLADQNRVSFPGECNDELICVPSRCRTNNSELLMNFNIEASLDSKNSLLHLTVREQICAELIVQGKSAKEIANKLFLSRRTVEKYIVRLKEKLGCRNVIHLAAVLSKMIT